MRLLEIIQDLYGDRNTDWIYVYPIESGSVLFSWHNESLSKVDVCPSSDILQLQNVLIHSKDNEKTLTVSDVFQRR